MARLPIHLHRRPKELALDFVFAAWLSYVLLSGRLIPSEAVALFRDEPPAVVVTDPLDEIKPIVPFQMDHDGLAPEA